MEGKIEKVRAAVEYIESHLTRKLELDDIARGVHYSKHHLHRVFSRTVGLTVREYVQRRQLTEAARLLVFSDRPILEIALTAGYESQQAFTSAFAAMYKQTPYQYRKNEEFYPLQLKFEFDGRYDMLKDAEVRWNTALAAEEDIPCWMELVRLVIDGFPHLDEEAYVRTLRGRIRADEALIIKDGKTAVGILIFSRRTGSIDFLGIHPLYRGKGIPQEFLARVIDELPEGRDVTITTYREDDKADTGRRREIMELGFAEAELLVEFGYPTQRFVLRRAGSAGRPADGNGEPHRKN